MAPTSTILSDQHNYTEEYQPSTEENKHSTGEWSNATPIKIEAEAEFSDDEGRRGWLCVLGSFLALFCTFGWLNW